MHRRLLSLLLSLNVLLLLITIAGFWRFGLSYAWADALPAVSLIVGLVALWLPHVLTPGRNASDQAVQESFLVLALCLGFGVIVGTAQYPIGAIGRPFVDATLARWDALLGISVPALMRWTSQHPWWVRYLFWTYNSFLAQLLLPILVLGFWAHDRAAIWEYAVHVHVCLAVTLLAFALWPAAHAFTFFGVQGMFDQTAITGQLETLRAGTLRVIHPGTLTGLIAVPSFHTAGALSVLWAFRRYRVWFAVLTILDIGLIAATMCSGMHYAVDVIAAGVLFAGSVGVSRVWLGRTTPQAHTITLARAA